MKNEHFRFGCGNIQTQGKAVPACRADPDVGGFAGPGIPVDRIGALGVAEYERIEFRLGDERNGTQQKKSRKKNEA